jgi:hypothetical protein
LGLTSIGCAAAFFGAGDLQAKMSTGADVLGPLIGGTALIVGLVVYHYLHRNALMPIRTVSSTVPVTGLLIALTARAAAVSMMELVLHALKKSSTPEQSALAFLPELVGAIAVAGLFGTLFRTRFTPLLALAACCSSPWSSSCEA